jgi:hemoglobin/transferrin/lactoferrin receptor protein
MNYLRFGASLFLTTALSLHAAAQDTSELPQATLPEVEVTPPETTDESPVDLPSVFNRSYNQAIGTSLSYPDLSELDFGQGGPFGETTGLFRSGGSLFDVPQASSIVTREVIQEKQAADMFHALQNEVGVMMQRTAAGQASPYIRGLTGQHVLILMDGIRLNNSITRSGPNQYFNTIDPGMVDHIEVLRGSGSTLWGGDAIGGVINVVSRGADTQYGKYQGNYGAPEFHQYYNTSDSSPYTRMNVEGWAGNTGYFGGGSYMDVHDLDTGFDFGRQPGTSYDQYAGDVKFNYLLDKDQMLTFALQHFEQDAVPRSDRFPGYPGDLNNSNNNAGALFFDPQQRDLGYLRYQALDVCEWSDAITITGSYHRQRESLTRGIPLNRFQETDVETLGFSALSAKDLDSFGKLTSGFDWYHDDVDSPFAGAPGPVIPDDAFYERFGVFTNWEVPITYRLSAMAGVRYELVDLAGTPRVPVIGPPPGTALIHISPHFEDVVGHVGLVYELDTRMHLVGTISEGFRAPNLDDLMANNPNVQQQGSSLPSLTLQPEHTVTYEVGLKTNSDRARGQIFYFWSDLNDYIVPITTTVPNQFAAANQDSYMHGVELDGEYLLEHGWSIYGNYWYTYGKNLVTGNPLSRVPPQQGILGLRWRETRLRGYFQVYTWLVDKQDRLDPVRDLSDERIPPGGTDAFATLNMRIGRSFGELYQHQVSLSLENITDTDYLVHGSGVYGTGITGRFGYSWDY